jgi:hypothetical protein
MEDLLQWFIETSSKDGNYLAGMLFAAAVFFSIFSISVYQILHLLIEWFRRIKPIKVVKVEKKIEHIMPFPEEVEKSYLEILKRLDNLEKNQNKKGA